MDPMLNLWLQELTPSHCLSSALARLIVVTGKGGVGKTTFALALTKKWRSEGREAFYLPFQQKAAKDLPLPPEHCLSLTVPESLEAFIGHKLHSTFLAKAAIKTPFLTALFDIIPSLGMLASLGHIVHLLKKNPHHYYIMDCPSTGHARMIFDGPKHFEKIFRVGQMQVDLKETQSWLIREENCKIIILTTAAEMPLEEMSELQTFFQENIEKKTIRIINMFLPLLVQHHSLPESLQHKFEYEKEIVRSLKGPQFIPYIPLSNYNAIVQFLSESDFIYDYKN
jgi:GTPase SAR1 family protein